MKKLIQFELRKIFSKRLTQVTLIALLLLSFLLGFSAYQNKTGRKQQRNNRHFRAHF